MNSRETLIWLNSIKGVGNRTIDKLTKHFVDISNIWTASTNYIMSLCDIDEKIKNEIISNRNENYFERLTSYILKNDIRVITYLDEDYPEKLKNIFDYPKVLYSKGEFNIEDKVAIAIVGSRKATSYGKWAADKFSRELARMGISIISGMARGIDTEAHKGAIKEHGHTIAVLGCGVDVVYPSSNRELYKDIISNGCVISEFSPGTHPINYNFPLRNRIISGLASGIIVIEAGEKSGSLITAEHAIEQGKDVFALPGNINNVLSKGTNQLIKEGAKLVMDVDDILEEISELNNKVNINKKIIKDYSFLSEDEMRIIECISTKPTHCDIISFTTGINISLVNSMLTVLEMKGMIKQLPGRVYTIS